MRETSPLQDYWENRLTRTPDLAGVGYLGLGLQYNNWLYRVRRAVFRRAVRSMLMDLRALSVLDVGCGTGFFIERWQELGVRKVSGVDLTAVAVATLKQKHPEVAVYQRDMGNEETEVPGGPFDAVSCFDVLYHIVDDVRYAAALRKICELLKPGGVFIWSDNFVHGQTLRAAHQVSRSLESIEDAVRAAGFRIVDRRPLFYLMNTPVDTKDRFLRVFWRLVRRTASRGEALGFAVGALLYPAERILTRFAKESPTSELMICEKPRK